jgi:hypothetical protein
MLMEQANALVDVFNNEPGDDYPMHAAYGETVHSSPVTSLYCFVRLVPVPHRRRDRVR